MMVFRLLVLHIKYQVINLLLLIAIYPQVTVYIYGRNATSFIAHLLSIIYKIAEYDTVYILGDVNSRIGDKIDFVSSINHIKNRHVTDTTTNSHGEVFLDFLLESKICVINGRICPENNNFTRVQTTGSSVVDYICTFHDNLDNCKYFNVHLMRSLLDKIGIFTDKIPDHSVLEFYFLPHYAGIENNIDISAASILQNVNNRQTSI